MRGTVQFTQDRRSVCCLLININVDSEACQLTRHVRHAQNTLSDPTPDRSWLFCSVLDPNPVSHLATASAVPPGPCWPGTRTCPGTWFPPFPLWGGKGGALPPGRALETQQGGPYIFPLSPPPFSSPSFPLSFRGGQPPFSLSPVDNTMTERQTRPDLVDQDRRHPCLNARPLRQGARSVGNPQLNPHGRQRSSDRHLQSRSNEVTTDGSCHHQPVSSLRLHTHSPRDRNHHPIIPQHHPPNTIHLTPNSQH